MCADVYGDGGNCSQLWWWWLYGSSGDVSKYHQHQYRPILIVILSVTISREAMTTRFSQTLGPSVILSRALKTPWNCCNNSFVPEPPYSATYSSRRSGTTLQGHQLAGTKLSNVNVCFLEYRCDSFKIILINYELYQLCIVYNIFYYI